MDLWGGGWRRWVVEHMVVCVGSMQWICGGGGLEEVGGLFISIYIYLYMPV